MTSENALKYIIKARGGGGGGGGERGGNYLYI